MKQIFFLIAALLSMTVQAQEYEARSEFFFCSLNEGKTMEDVVAQSEAYGKFSTDMGTKYAQAILTPMHAGDTTNYDIFSGYSAQVDSPTTVVVKRGAHRCR